jgi:hypothetical protein
LALNLPFPAFLNAVRAAVCAAAFADRSLKCDHLAGNSDQVRVSHYRHWLSFIFRQTHSDAIRFVAKFLDGSLVPELAFLVFKTLSFAPPDLAGAISEMRPLPPNGCSFSDPFDGFRD